MPEPTAATDTAQAADSTVVTDPKIDAQPQAGGRDDDAFDKDRALKTIGTLRDEVKTFKAQAREAEQLRAKLKEHEDAKLSETERLNNRIKELEEAQQAKERQVRDLSARAALSLAASRSGARHPDLVVRAVDFEALEFDPNGQPKNADDLIGTVRKQYPDLFVPARGSADGGSGTHNGQTGLSMNDIIRRAAGRSA